MEEQKPETTDFEANVIERQRNFASRAAGAVTGAVAGIMVGQRMLKKSLRSYLQRGLFARDWKPGTVEDVIVGVAKGDLDTMSGAIISSQKSAKLAPFRESLYPHLSGNGTLVGDEVMNEALQKLFEANITPHPNANEASHGKFVLKDGFLKTAVDKFNSETKKLQDESKTAMEKLEQKYFKLTPDICKKQLEETSEKVAAAKTPEAREHIIAEFDAGVHTEGKKPMNGSYLKFREEEHKIAANLRRNTNDLKQALVDIPIYDEMMKAGKQPGRMGLKLRHAHDRGEIIAFSAGAAVALGYIVHKAVKTYVHRNEKDKDTDRSFQQGVIAGRDAARHEQSSII